jgi:hypothetical protein
LPRERRFILLSLPAQMQAPGCPRLAAPARRETWSPALARLPFLVGAEGEAGQDGWQAAPPGRRLLTDTKPRRSPQSTANPSDLPRVFEERRAPVSPAHLLLLRCPELPALPAPLSARCRLRAPPSPRAPGSPARPLLARPAPLRARRAPGAPASLAHRARGALLARRLLADSREPPRWEAEVSGGRWPQPARPGWKGSAWEQT